MAGQIRGSQLSSTIILSGSFSGSFIGDGSGLTGTGGSTPTLQQITDAGSSTTTSITASIISASGDIVGNNLSGTNTGDQDLSNLVTNSSTASFAITGSNVLFGNITSSGNISASGDISAVTASLQRIEFPDDSDIISTPAGHKLEFGASELKLTSGDDVFLQLDDTITFANAQTNIPGNIIAGGTISNISTTHVTASGNISASNTVFGVTGSFNQISSNPASIKTNITMGSSNIDIGNTSTAASLGGSSFPFTKIAGSTNFQGMVAATNFLVGSGSLGEALGGIPVNSTLRIGGVGTGFLGTTYTVGVDITGNVTASGNISASGDIIANKVTADVVDTSFETFLNFEAATAFTFIAPFPLTINFTGSSTSSMDVAGFVTASANTSTFSVQQTPPITLNIFDKLKITPSSSGLFSFSGSRTI